MLEKFSKNLFFNIPRRAVASTVQYSGFRRVLAATWAFIFYVMREHEKNTQQPTISIDGGGKTYQLDLAGLTDFLDNCKENCKIEGVDTLQAVLNVITDMVIDGTPDDYDAVEIKQPLKLLRQLGYLFNTLLLEKH